MGGNSIYKELLEYFKYDVETATSSAFVQQRDKILPSALEYLFKTFTNSFNNLREFYKNKDSVTPAYNSNSD